LIRDCWEPEYYMRPSFKDIITRIESIMVDATVIDKAAGNLWKNNFAGQIHAPWTKFASVFFKELKITNDAKSLDYLCLRKILTAEDAHDDKLVVNLEQYALIFKWFGPMQTATWNVMTRMKGVMQNPWFSGDIQKNKCETLLGGFSTQPGTFMVRLSTTEPIEKTPFSLSKVSRDGTVSHQRIQARDGAKAYHIALKKKDGTPFEIEAAGGVEVLVETEGRKHLSLLQACPGSPFAEIFAGKKATSGYNYDNYVEEDTSDINAHSHH